MSNGYGVVARTLAGLGIRHMFGVIGIPVTELASAAQARAALPGLRALLRMLSMRSDASRASLATAT